MKKGNPRFFCEHCGAEVRRDVERCPSCGRSFTSVRCPKCSYTGDESLFTNGCPECGYSAHFDDWPGFSPLESREVSQKNGPLPLWVYLLTITAFVTTAGIFLYHLLK